MDLSLSPVERELQERARSFVRGVLQPLEREFERAGGRLPRTMGRDLRRAAIEARLHGGSLPREVRGQGWSVLEQGSERPPTTKAGLPLSMAGLPEAGRWV